MTADAPTSIVIVALPADDDPVQGIGPEQKHATILYFGSPDDHGDPARLSGAKDLLSQVLAVAAQSTAPFEASVTGTGELGAEGAQVWLLDSPQLHRLFAELPGIDSEVQSLYDGADVTRYPDYKPHVTIGYTGDDSEGSGTGQSVTADDMTAAQDVKRIRFDRLALWHGDDQTEFPLTGTQEGDATMSAGIEIREAAGVLTEAAAGSATPGHDGVWPVQIISAGWGSSGYYSPDVLREAADKALIQAGTPVFFDHSSESERRDRPERSVRDIGAVFTGPAKYDATRKRLLGEIRVFTPYRDFVSEIGKHIGMSISGSASDVAEGRAEGRSGKIIKGLAHINSVDLVTKAGRGGKILTSLMESAREHMAEAPVIPALAAAPLVESYTALLEAGGQATHPGDTERLMKYWAEGEGAGKIRWGVDGDFDRCVRHLGKYVADPKGLCSNLHVRATGARPGHAAGESARPSAGPTHVPATRPDGTQEGATMPKIEIEESEHTRLTETAGRVATLEAEKRTWEAERTSLTTDLSKAQGDLTEARSALIPNKDLREAIANLTRENAMLRAREVAAPMISEALDDALIGETAKARLGAELLEGITLKEADDGGKPVLDTDTLSEAINGKVRVAEAEAQELREAMGVGRPRGLGQSTGGGLLVEQKLTEYADTTAGALGRAFGLSEASAKTAAQGR